jgi:hypothetical protein
MYTEEQLEKIDRLRLEAVKEREGRQTNFQREKEIEAWRQSRTLKVGSPVYVTVDGKTISGYVWTYQPFELKKNGRELFIKMFIKQYMRSKPHMVG